MPIEMIFISWFVEHNTLYNVTIWLSVLMLMFSVSQQLVLDPQVCPLVSNWLTHTATLYSFSHGFAIVIRVSFACRKKEKLWPKGKQPKLGSSVPCNTCNPSVHRHRWINVFLMVCKMVVRLAVCVPPNPHENKPPTSYRGPQKTADHRG